jgi:hypothetical protein
LFGFNQNQRWEIYLGVSNRADYVNDLIEFYDKGYYLIGGYEGTNGWNIKTDINGLELYEKDIYHNEYNLAEQAATQDNYGNLYICGYMVISEHTWPFIAKYDSCGENIWCRIYMNNYDYNYGWASDIVISEEGEILILVYLNSDERNKQIFIISYNDYGNINWINHYA